MTPPATDGDWLQTRVDNGKSFADYLKVSGTTWFQKLNIENNATQLAPKWKKAKSPGSIPPHMRTKVLETKKFCCKKVQDFLQTAPD